MIITHETFNPENMIFKVVKTKFGQRIQIKYNYPGGIDDFHIQTPALKSCSLIYNRFLRFNSFGFSMIVTMYERQLGPTEEESKTISMLESILERIQDYILAEGLSKKHVVEEMTIFRQKEGKPPKMYLKLKTAYRSTDSILPRPAQITTGFYNTDGRQIDPLTLISKPIRCRAVLDLTCSVFIGSGKPSVQLRVEDAVLAERTE